MSIIINEISILHNLTLSKNHFQLKMMLTRNLRKEFGVFERWFALRCSNPSLEEHFAFIKRPVLMKTFMLMYQRLPQTEEEYDSIYESTRARVHYMREMVKICDEIEEEYDLVVGTRCDRTGRCVFEGNSIIDLLNQFRWVKQQMYKWGEQ